MAHSSSCVASTLAWAKVWIRSARSRRRRVTAAIAASSWVGGPKKTSPVPLREGCGSATRRPPDMSTRACSPLAASPEAGASLVGARDASSGAARAASSKTASPPPPSAPSR